jgi:hypothetical protein
MTPTTMTFRSDADGVLSVVLPLGLAEANQEFRVTVEPIRKKPPMTVEQKAEWHAWVHRMAGSWQGDFERPPQGEYEEREPLS